MQRRGRIGAAVVVATLVAGAGVSRVDAPVEQARATAPVVIDSDARPRRAARPRAERPASPPATSEDDPVGPPAEALPHAAPTDRLEPLDGIEVDLEPRTFTGRVVDVEGLGVGDVDVDLRSTWLSGEVAGAICEWNFSGGYSGPERDWDWPGATSTARTREDGTFRLRYHEGGPRTLLVHRRGRVLACAPVDGRDDATVNVAERGTRIEGRVTDADDGRPVADASVTAWASTWPDPSVRAGLGPWLAGCAAWRGETVTDADGRWSLEGVPAGRIECRVRGEGYAAPAVERHAVTPGEAGVPWVTKLERGVVTEVVCLDDATGEPLEGADVALSEGWGTIAGPSGPDGRLQVRTRPSADFDDVFFGSPTTYIVRATDRVPACLVRADAAKRVALDPESPGVPPIAVRLQRPATVRLRIVDADGAPVKDALVHTLDEITGRVILNGQTAYFRGSQRDHPPAFSVERSDADGLVTLTGCPPGRAVLSTYVRGEFVVLRQGRRPLRVSTVQDLAPGEVRDLGVWSLPRRD